MKMYDPHGNELMNAQSLERQGDDLVMKGKMMGTMPATIHIRPEELWEARHLLSWSVLSYLPAMFIKGWRRSRKAAATTGGAQQGKPAR